VKKKIKIPQNAKEKMKMNLRNRHILLAHEVERRLKNAITNEGERIAMKKDEVKVEVEIEKEAEAGVNQNHRVAVAVAVGLGIKKRRTVKKKKRNKILLNKCKN
jgi:predicted molibdopterin-dependent oxidoreductase YjgC